MNIKQGTVITSQLCVVIIAAAYHIYSAGSLADMAGSGIIS